MATGISSPLALGGLYPSVDGGYVAANGKPFTSVSNAESALNGFPSKLSESCVGLTVLVKESGWTEAKEYWVQPKGTTPETYGLVEKGKGVTDYEELENKPTISDGWQGSTQIPLSGNVKVTATAATSGQTTGVTVTAENGGITMAFTLEKGADGVNGTNGIDGKSAFEVWKEATGRTTANEAEYIEDLQTKVAKWIPVAYEALSPAPSIGDAVTFTNPPSTPIDGAIVLMPNATSSATATMMFAVSEDPNTQGSYIYTYIGNLNVDSTGLLSISDVDGTGLANPLPNALAKAVDVMQLAAKLDGVAASESKASGYSLNAGVLNAVTKEIIGTAGAARYTVIPVGDAKRVRFLGVSYGDTNTSYNYGFGFYNSSNEIFGTKRYEGRNDSGNNVTQEYVEDIPDGAVSLICSVVLASNMLNESNFYCYLQSGKNVLDMIPQIDDVLGLSKTDKVVSNARVAELNNEIKELKESMRSRTEIDFTHIGLINTSGRPAVSSAYKYSNPISIRSGYVVNVFSRGYNYAPISKCDSDGTNISVVITETDNTISERKTYTWTADEDCHIIVCGQFYFENEYAEAWYLGEIEPEQSSEQKENNLIAKLTMAYLSSNGTIYQYNTNNNLEANAKKTVANVHFIELDGYKSGSAIECTPFAEINVGETYKIYFFNSSYAAISSSTLTVENQYTAVIPNGTKFVRLAFSSSNDLTYSVRYVELKVKADILRWHGVRNFLETPDYIKPVGSQTAYGTELKYYRTIFEVPYKGDRLWNVGWFFYSPFYKPIGEKTKLAILYTGSTAYKFNKDWSYFSDNYHSIVFSLVHSGYNVALCSCLASLYGPNSADSAGPNQVTDCSGDQLSINAYQSYYQYLIDNFNVEEKPYIIGYSNGGLPSGRINILGDIPAKVIAGGAIVTELIALFRILGYPIHINKIMHNCGVPDTVVVEHASAYFTADDYNVFKEQGDILKNYSPMFMSCKGLDWDTYIDTMKDVSFVNMETNQGMVNLMANVEIQSEIPIKIWISRDDENVSYGIEKFYIEAVNRGGGRAFLRTMPNDAGKHGMGNYSNPDSIKVQNYHFKDGTVADTTLFMSEVIDWFDQWK